MSLTRRIAWNTLLQLISRVGGTLLGLFSLAILTRYLGTAGYGAFTTVTGFLQFFGIVVDLGLTLTAVQMISEPQADERRIMGTIFSLRFFTAVIFFGLSAVLVMFFPYSAEVKIGTAVTSIAFLFMTQSQVLVGIFQKYLAMSRAAVAEIIGRAVLLVGIIFSAWQNWGLMGALLSLVAANGIQLALSFIFAQKLIPFRLQWERKLAKSIFLRTWPIGLSIAFNLVYLKGDVILLSLFRSQSEVGLYGAAYKVIDVVTVVPMMFMGIVLPLLISSWVSADKEMFRRRFQKSFDFLTLLALPIAGGGLVLGKDLMAFVAGQPFRHSGELLQILIFASLAVFFSGLYGHIVVAIGKQRKSIWGYAIDAFLSLAAYLIFVPRYGAPAAAWVTVFSEVFIAVYTFILVSRETRVLPALGTSAKAVLATIFMMLVLLALPHWQVIIMVLIGAVVYGLFLYILRAVKKETIGEVFSLGEVGQKL